MSSFPASSRDDVHTARAIGLSHTSGDLSRRGNGANDQGRDHMHRVIGARRWARLLGAAVLGGAFAAGALAAAASGGGSPHRPRPEPRSTCDLSDHSDYSNGPISAVRTPTVLDNGDATLANPSTDGDRANASPTVTGPTASGQRSDRATRPTAWRTAWPTALIHPRPSPKAGPPPSLRGDRDGHEQRPRSGSRTVGFVVSGRRSVGHSSDGAHTYLFRDLAEAVGAHQGRAQLEPGGHAELVHQLRDPPTDRTHVDAQLGGDGVVGRPGHHQRDQHLPTGIRLDHARPWS